MQLEGGVEMEMRDKLKRLCVKTAMAIVLALAAARWGIPYGLAHRGYSAIGGEYLLIVLAAAFPFLLLSDRRRR